MLRTSLLVVLLVCVAEILANSVNRRFGQQNRIRGNHGNHLRYKINNNFPNEVIAANTTTPRATKRLVCYLGSWANYRWGVAAYPIESIDPTLCTHAIYGFAQLSNNQIAPYDTWLDLGDSSPGSGLHGYERFIALKQINPNLKTLIAIGGWNDGSEKYSAMVSSSATRQTFIQSVISFLAKYPFDGLDLDWEYPANRGGVAADKANFISLVQELKAAFAPYGYLLSAATSPGKGTIDIAYDIPKMCAALDFVNVMAYDYHGSWDEPLVTGFNAPLYYRPGDAIPEFNSNYTINYYINGGCPAAKINMGMPLYGRSFTLTNPSNYGVNAPASDGGTAGSYTQEAGYLSYFEICYKRDTEVWTSYWDSTTLTPYMVAGNQWVGYDDETSIGYKANYVVSKGLGGGMVWAVDLDDFSNRCGEGNYPLLRTIYTVLNGGAAPTAAPTTAPTVTTTTASTTTTPTTTTPTTTTSSTTTRPTSTSSSTSTSSTTTTRTTTTSAPTTTTASTTTTPTTTTANPGGFTCPGNGLFADPTNCAKFYQCASNGAGGYSKWSLSCSSGLVFDASIGNCNYATLVTC